jgi:hypothetical protein
VEAGKGSSAVILHWIIVLGGLLIAWPHYARDEYAAVQGQYCGAFSDSISMNCEFPTLDMCKQAMRILGGSCTTFSVKNLTGSAAMGQRSYDVSKILPPSTHPVPIGRDCSSSAASRSVSCGRRIDEIKSF